MNSQDLVSKTIHTSINAGRTVGLCEAMSAVTEYSQLIVDSRHYTSEQKALLCACLSIVGDKINDLRKNIESEAV